MRYQGQGVWQFPALFLLHILLIGLLFLLPYHNNILESAYRMFQQLFRRLLVSTTISSAAWISSRRLVSTFSSSALELSSSPESSHALVMNIGTSKRSHSICFLICISR